MEAWTARAAFVVEVLSIIAEGAPEDIQMAIEQG